MPEVVQEIGAVAGLAAVVGLAVLSVLYFSQARDVKRLREWAGRAPERSAELGVPAVPARVQAQPQTAQQQPAGAPAAGAPAIPQPAGTQAQAGVKPGQPVPQPAGAQAQGGAGQPGQPVAQPAAAQGQGDATKPGQPVPQPAAAQGQEGATKPGQPVVQPAAAQGQGDAAKPGDAAPQPVAADAQGGAAKPGQPQTAGAQAQAAKANAEPAEDGAPADEDKTVKVGQGAPAMAAAAGATAAAATQTKPAPAQETKPAQTGGNAKPASAPAVPGGPGGPATPAGGRPSGAPPAVPAAQRAPVRPMLPARPMPQQTAILPPRRQPWYRRLLASPRYLVLFIAGILILGGAAAFGVDQLSSGDSDPATPAAENAPPAADGEQAEDGSGEKKRTPIVRANVTVAVLNGTTVPNLAQQISERVEAKGFEVGTVANSADQEQQRAESVVLFAPGHEREATAVVRALQINQRQRIDPASQELAGDATVVVIAGADLAQ